MADGGHILLREGQNLSEAVNRSVGAVTAIAAATTRGKMTSPSRRLAALKAL